LHHGEFWEFRLTQELLKSRLLSLKSQCNDFEIMLKSLPIRKCDRLEFLNWIQTKMQTLIAALSRMNDCVKADLVNALGKPGVSGDPIRILGAVDASFTACRGFFVFELAIRAMEPPADLIGVRDDFRGIGSWVVETVQQLADNWG